LIGTFFLVLTIGMVVVDGTPLAPIAIGSTLMVMVYMGGHISGAHYNPAVTIGLYLRGATDKSDVLPYIAAQVLGAWLAASAVQLLTGQTFAPAPGADASIAQAVLAEILLTFALVLVIMNVATSKATEGNSYYGLAIGFTVAAGAFAVGGVSGGAFNPAVGTGPIIVDALVGDGGFGNLWLYWVAPVLGSLGAFVVFRMQEGSAGGD
jgi:aquaporin Z